MQSNLGYDFLYSFLLPIYGKGLAYSWIQLLNSGLEHCLQFHEFVLRPNVYILCIFVDLTCTFNVASENVFKKKTTLAFDIS